MSEHTDWMEKYREEERVNGEKGKAYLLSLVPVLEKGGAAKLVVHYDGSGDSGEIQSIHAWANESDDNRNGHSVEVVGLDEQKIDEATCNVLSGLGIDWYNNEGGYGYVILTVSTGKITVENNQRFEDSTYSEHEV